MSRKLWIMIHLYLAAFVAPALILVSITGGLYLSGNKGSVNKVTQNVPVSAMLDFEAETLDADVRALLQSAGLEADYEYLKNRGSTLQTRPTSRQHYEISKTRTGLIITRNDPSLQYAMMELHKGHGPKVFKLYQKFVAVALLLIVLSGLWLGLTAPLLRKKTLLTSGVGLVAFLLLAFIL